MAIAPSPLLVSCRKLRRLSKRRPECDIECLDIPLIPPDNIEKLCWEIVF